jgi:hypothetical protein
LIVEKLHIPLWKESDDIERQDEKSVPCFHTYILKV